MHKQKTIIKKQRQKRRKDTIIQTTEQKKKQNEKNKRENTHDLLKCGEDKNRKEIELRFYI